MLRAIRTLTEVKKIIDADEYPIEFKDILRDILVNRFFFYLTFLFSKKFDISYFTEINASRILNDFDPGLDQRLVGSFWNFMTNYFYSICNEANFHRFKKMVNQRFLYFPSMNKKEYLQYYYNKLKLQDELNLLEQIREPETGGTTYIELDNGKKVSQDILRSIGEFYTIYPFLKNKTSWTIGEIGAGYGRTTFVFLKAAEILDVDSLNIYIFDIPPTILISSKYFSLNKTCFSKTNIEFYSATGTLEDSIQNKLRLKFCLPIQLEQLPTSIFDVILSISTFCEMEQAAVNHYFDLIDQKLKTNGVFYTKQLGRNAKDLALYTPTHLKQYPYKSNWQKILDEPSEPSFFFNALFVKTS